MEGWRRVEGRKARIKEGEEGGKNNIKYIKLWLKISTNTENYNNDLVILATGILHVRVRVCICMCVCMCVIFNNSTVYKQASNHMPHKFINHSIQGRRKVRGMRGEKVRGDAREGGERGWEGRRWEGRKEGVGKDDSWEEGEGVNARVNV